MLAALVLWPLLAHAAPPGDCPPIASLVPAFDSASIASYCDSSLLTCRLPLLRIATRSRKIQQQAKRACEAVAKTAESSAEGQSEAETKAGELLRVARDEMRKLVDLLAKDFTGTQADLKRALASLAEGPAKEALRAALASEKGARASSITGAATLADPAVAGDENLFAARNGASFGHALAVELERRRGELRELDALAGTAGARVGSLKARNAEPLPSPKVRAAPGSTAHPTAPGAASTITGPLPEKP